MEAWIRTLMEHGDLRARVCLSDQMAAAGLMEEAIESYGESANHGDPVAMLRLAVILPAQGDFVAGRRWLERAAAAGHPSAAHDLASLLDQESKSAEAAQWYKRAAELGDERASARLKALAAARPQSDDELVARASGSFDIGATVATVAVTLVLAEFAKTLTAKLAEDSYAGAKRWLRRLASRGDPSADPPEPEGSNVLLLLEDADSDSPASVGLWLDAPSEALAELTPERIAELTGPRRRWRLRSRPARRLFWNQAAGEWQTFEH